MCWTKPLANSEVGSLGCAEREVYCVKDCRDQLPFAEMMGGKVRMPPPWRA